VNRLARTLLAALAGAVLAGSITAVIDTSAQATAGAPRLEAPMQKLTVGQDQHSAFPGMARMWDGTLRLVWRQGSDHYRTRDGRIVTAQSRDDGVTWENVQTVRANPDYRDAFVSVIDGIEFWSWFGASASNPAMGAAVMRYMNAESRRVDALPYGAVSAPVVKLPDGRLGLPFYGRKTGETLDTAWMGWSSDNGWTWSTNRIVNFIGSGLSTAEPYLVVNGYSLHMLYRWGDSAIGIRSSNDSGQTWDQPRLIRNDATGRPTTIAVSGGRLVMVYRDLPAKNARMAYSLDNGWTWHDAGIILAAPTGSPNGMTYATMVEVEPGTVRVVVGMEQADGSSDLWGGTVTVP
jgi:hypothetical protein